MTILRYIWNPTEAKPRSRTRFNLWLHRTVVLAFVPLVWFCWGESPAAGLIMVVSLVTQLTSSYGNVQVGDVRENE